MKKMLSIVAMFLMATSAFAFVPLTNAQNTVGSYERGATRGMFYNELDIISAAPVELLDFSGNALYTNWGNIRNYNDIVNYGKALNWGPNQNNTDISYFTFGLTGNPLSSIGINDSRSGIVYQNFGGKLAPIFNLDSVVGNDSEGQWKNETYNIRFATAPATDRTQTTIGSNLKYYTNTTNTQWNAGSSYKLMDKISLGLSLSRRTDSIVLNTEGTKTYSEIFNTVNGAILVGMPVTSTEGTSLSVSYPKQAVDQNSTSITDILPQARISVSDGLYADVGVGLRFSKVTNPGTVVANENTVITVSAREGVAISTAIGGLNSYQRFNTGTAIVSKTNLDYATQTLNGNVNLFTASFTGAAGTGVSDFSDERSGIAPLVRVEVKKSFKKFDAFGIANFDTLSRDVDASQTNREYANTRHTLYAGAAADVVDNFTGRDYTQLLTYKGTASDTNLDLGLKINMKELEGIRVSLGGFIQRSVSKTDLDTTSGSRELVSYRDGDGLTISSSSVGGNTPAQILTNKPGPVDGSLTETNPNGTGRTDLGLPTTGDGEGDWSQTISRAGTQLSETITTKYMVPVGIEIPLSKKFTFRAGTEYVMTKTQTTVKTNNTLETTVTVATPLGEAAKSRTDYSADLAETKSILYSESHDVFYTYGLQFDATPSLTIACNAFLDTNPDGVGTDGGDRASIFDLTTYRNLSLSAAIKF
ncbi:MAG: hypothetical protein PHE88_06995 [Elusimicrobia bacterium]|nr:hypothetical protein [Elusimicrobiota bacterium]